jgi:hypothetical protein
LVGRPGDPAAPVRSRWLDRRWLIGALALATMLRVAVTVAYYPALEFRGDSYAYLTNAAHLRPGLWHPLVYPTFLRVLSLCQLLVVVPLVQHLLGLATGLLIYRLLTEQGVGDFGATLAAAPVLLDAYQIDVEHMILSEALFGFLVIAGVYLLLRADRALHLHVLGGLLLGVATLTRIVGLPCAGVVLLALLIRRVGLRRLAATGAAVVLPVLGYLVTYHHQYDSYALSSYNGRALYGGVATFAHCDTLPSATDRLLCPRVPVPQRAGNNQYAWSAESPLQLLPKQRAEADTAAGSTVENSRASADRNSISDDRAAGTFARNVINRQRWDYVRHAGGIFGHFLAPYRYFGQRDFPDVSWQFPTRIDPPPPWNNEVAHEGFGNNPTHPHLLHPVADVLRGYQRFGYTPNVVLPLGLVIGCWAGVRRRRDPRALVTAVLVGCGAAALAIPAIGLDFEHRYALPAQMFLPAAAVLGMSLLSGQRQRGPAWRPRAALAVAGVAGLGVNAAAGGMVSADRQAPAVIAAIGTLQQLPGAPLEISVEPPTYARTRCVRVFGSEAYHLVWQANFHVRARLLADGDRVVQVAGFNLLGPPQVPYLRPYPTRDVRGLPDTMLSRTGDLTGGLVQFSLESTNGVLIYNDALGGGVVAWRYAVLGPKGVALPGTPCTPPANRPSGTTF